jgi:hypothetical protein
MDRYSAHLHTHQRSFTYIMHIAVGVHQNTS